MLGIGSIGAGLAKFVARPAAHAADERFLAQVLGPAPDFLAAAALPFLFVVVGSRLTWPFRRIPFLANCFWGWAILLNNEIWQVGDGSRRFDVADLVASLAGVAVAYLVYQRWVAPPAAAPGEDA